MRNIIFIRSGGEISERKSSYDYGNKLDRSFWYFDFVMGNY
jgi:hypothetical protein